MTKTKTTRPSKQAVRDHMERRTHQEDPPPSPEEIRRELGWELIKHDRFPEVPD